MHIRPAILADIPLLAAMNHQLIRDEGSANPMTLPQLETRMRTFLTTNYTAHLFFESETSPSPLGYTLHRPDPGPPPHLFIRQFFIAPSHRRQGLGKIAFTWLSQNPWKPHTHLRLDVLTHNTPALHFYRSLGFADHCLTLQKQNPAFT